MDRTAYRSAFRGSRASNDPPRTGEVKSPVGAATSTSVQDEYMQTKERWDPTGPTAGVSSPMTMGDQAMALRSPGHLDPGTTGMRYQSWYEMPMELRRVMAAAMK